MKKQKAQVRLPIWSRLRSQPSNLESAPLTQVPLADINCALSITSYSTIKMALLVEASPHPPFLVEASYDMSYLLK